MGRKVAFELLVSFIILQFHIMGTFALPLRITGNTATPDTDKFKYTIIEVQNNTVPVMRNDTAHNDESVQLDEDGALDRLREQIIFAKRTQHKIFAHDPEDILFMLTALILLFFHLFFMDMFIRLTRARFQTNSRYQYLSTVHLFLAFLVCAVYFLLILLHYRDSQYCG